MDRKILKNSAWLFTAQALVKVISFFYTIFLARSLGVSDFGLYVTALAYFALISSVADFGFNRFLIREGARNLEKLSVYLYCTVFLRLVLTTLVFLIFSLWLYLVDPDNLRAKLSILAVLAVLPQSLALTFDAVLVAIQKLKFSALSLLGLSLLTTIVGISLILMGFGPLGAVGAVLFGQTGYVLLLFYSLNLNHLTFKPTFSWDEIKIIIKGSLPYGILSVLGLLYFRIDTLLLSYLKGPVSAGFYGAAFKFLEALVFIPSALATALFPVLAKLHDEDISQIKKIYFSAVKLLGLLSLPVFISFFFLLPYVIRFLLPQYLPSIQALQILSLAIPFMFIHVPGVLVLISSDKYLKPMILLSIFTLTFNIVLNFLLIPQFDFIGASWVTVLSEALSFLIFFTLLYFKLLKNA